ncbi:MAG: hypothetical protein MZV70_56200 [Desulfobacterales bacterium]|nr:hypothetical protein [Desulfobacterales bacterium]
MFLGQWFAGFSRVSSDAQRAGAEPAIVLWDPETGHRLLERRLRAAQSITRSPGS